MTSTRLAADVRERDDADTRCAQCGAELAEDQEWCLECGGARTLIHRGPDWRLPLAVIAVVIVLAIGGFVVAVISISNDSGNPTAANPPTHSRAATVERERRDERHHSRGLAGKRRGLAGGSSGVDRCARL